MKAYACRLGGEWKGFVQTPTGYYVELFLYSDSKEDCERYLRECGFTVVEKP